MCFGQHSKVPLCHIDTQNKCPQDELVCLRGQYLLFMKRQEKGFALLSFCLDSDLFIMEILLDEKLERFQTDIIWGQCELNQSQWDYLMSLYLFSQYFEYSCSFCYKRICSSSLFKKEIKDIILKGQETSMGI